MVLRVETQDIPEPKPGEVLIRMLSAPIHPKELGFIRNAAGRSLPSGLGGEGVGIVVKNGGGWYGWYLLGKRVSCCSDPNTSRGTWAEYLCVKAEYCMPVRSDVTDDEASCIMVNPFTTLMFMDKIRAGHHKAAIQTAALSAVGRMLIRECRRSNIPLINIVRKPQQIQEVFDEGGEYALNSEDPDFPQQLKALCDSLQASVAFDSVAGVVASHIFNCMKGPGVIYIYGFLSGQPVSNLRGPSFVFERKRIEGITFESWLKTQSYWSLYSLHRQLQDLVKTTLKTRIRGRYSLENLQEAIRYYKANMSDGKVLLQMPKL